MEFQAEINFFLKLMHSFRIPTKIMTYGVEQPYPFDNGIRLLLNPQTDYRQIADEIILNIGEKTIYKVTDDFQSSYMFMRLSETEDTIIVVGPYTSTEITRSSIIRKSKSQAITPEFLSTLERYFSTVAYIPDDHSLTVALYTLGEKIWNTEQLGVENLQSSLLSFEGNPFESSEGDINIINDYDINVVERRYLSENKLITAVASGRTHEAERLLKGFSQAAVEQRTTEPTRNARNYLIILNTLLRKAVEQKGVHPFHIDRVSSKFARRIENIGSWSDVGPLCKDMANKYCALVNDLTLNSLSPIVRQAVTLIDSDLTADLKLNSIAYKVGVNPSYLSSIFKKETGKTVTDFVNSRRIEQAVFLLGATQMPIATVGQHCGINDNNYFTRIFKKYTGKTPAEWRKR